MSYTELIVFKRGKMQKGPEFKNAWGGAARIWDALFKAYIPKRHEYDTWLSCIDDNRLWDLAGRKDITEFERAVHAFTFDRFYVRRKNFARMANDLRSFVQKYPAGEGVDHLPSFAKWLDENSFPDAVGLYGTSVAENPWIRTKTCPHCGSYTDETETVPLSEGTEVYEWLS